MRGGWRWCTRTRAGRWVGSRRRCKAMLSLVADAIRDIPDLAARVFSALEGLQVRLIAKVLHDGV